jgi:hypothetical protein
MSLSQLGNSSNKVTFNLLAADNAMTITLNPDSTTFLGEVLVYESNQRGMGAALNVTIDVSSYLAAFKALNPSMTTVQLTVAYLNYNGSGAYNYTIAGPGVTLPTKKGALPTMTSAMDSYIVNIF